MNVNVNSKNPNKLINPIKAVDEITKGVKQASDGIINNTLLEKPNFPNIGGEIDGEKKKWENVMKLYRSNYSDKLIESFIRLFKDLENFEIFCDSEDTICSSFVISKLNKEALVILLGLCGTPEEFTKLCKDYMFILKDINKDNLVFLLKHFNIHNVNDFREFFNSKKISYLLNSNVDLSKINNIDDLKNKNTYRFYSELGIPNKKNLFNVESQGSHFYNGFLSEMKKHPDTEQSILFEKMISKVFTKITKGFKEIDVKTRTRNGKRINSYQESRMDKKDLYLNKKLKINKNKHELAIYTRYSQTVDFPEIAEAIILFAKKYINEGLSGYFSSIRIIPRLPNSKPSEFLFDDSTKFYDVKGEEFISALHSFSSALFLSHSSNSKPFNTPNIVSKSMVEGKNDTVSNIDLEAYYGYAEMLINNDIEHILTEILNNLLNLENRLNKIK